MGQVAEEEQAFESVTLGHIRSHGCRDLLVYCGAMDCNHGSVMNADPCRMICPYDR